MTPATPPQEVAQADTAGKGIVLGEGVVLPEELVTETLAILGKRNSGKTTTARVLAEGLLAVDLPVVVIDPTGVWWGLRTSADGAGDGFPVVIFGGEHGDVPLEETAGTVIAEVVVGRRLSTVLDLSGLSKSAGRRFVADFLERLYRINKEACHVVVDEADLFAPKFASRDTARVLGAMEDLFRRGRVKGLGASALTQRHVDCIFKRCCGLVASNSRSCCLQHRGTARVCGMAGPAGQYQRALVSRGPKLRPACSGGTRRPRS